MAVFLCPTDDGVLTESQPWGVFTMGNYHVFFGGANLGDALGMYNGTVPTTGRAAFGVNWGARVADFTDGTSNTMVMGEYLRSRGGARDQRGLLWGDQPGYGHIYAQLNPNTSTADFIYVNWCDNQPGLNLPCIDGDTGPNNTVASRSRHAGGVNVVLGDGSVRFIQQNIANTTWRALVTIAGSEAVGDF